MYFFKSFLSFVNSHNTTIKPYHKTMEDLISTIINNTITSFDFPFCITVNIATYLIIKSITDYKTKSKLSTWTKRLIFLFVSVIIAIIYYATGSDPKTILNSFILAPVSWSWIFKPICDKLNIGYSAKVTTK